MAAWHLGSRADTTDKNDSLSAPALDSQKSASHTHTHTHTQTHTNHTRHLAPTDQTLMPLKIR